MGTQEQEVLAHLFEKPAFWYYFSIKEMLDDDFFLSWIFSEVRLTRFTPLVCNRIGRIVRIFTDSLQCIIVLLSKVIIFAQIC